MSHLPSLNLGSVRDEAYLPKTDSWPATEFPPLLLHILVESLLGYINRIEISIRPADAHEFVGVQRGMAVCSHPWDAQDLSYQVCLALLLRDGIWCCREAHHRPVHA